MKLFKNGDHNGNAGDDSENRKTWDGGHERNDEVLKAEVEQTQQKF